MTVMASQTTGVSIVCSTVCAGANQRKHQSSASLALWGESTADRWFPSQRASNAENVSIWWRHHDNHKSIMVKDVFIVFILLLSSWFRTSPIRQQQHEYNVYISFIATEVIFSEIQVHVLCVSAGTTQSQQHVISPVHDVSSLLLNWWIAEITL